MKTFECNRGGRFSLLILSGCKKVFVPARACARISDMRTLFLFKTGLALGLLAGCAATLPFRPNAQTMEKVSCLARSLAGVPYTFGGQSPEGFDCSGFVQYVFKKAAGIRLPRTSREQFRCGLAVPLGQEQPTDLIFFRLSGGGPSHVGIYLGGGKFIHAPSEGGSVCIADANSDYWRERRLELRRVLQN